MWLVKVTVQLESGRRMGHERRADDDQDAKRAAAAGVFQWTTPKRKIVVL